MSKPKDITNNFTVKNFTYLEGTILKFDEGRYNIEVPIEKFILDEKTIETSLRLDYISLPNKLETYIGEKIAFPVNPIEGYIDGSIYLRDAHNPVDVTEIHFLELENDRLVVEMTVNFVFDFEGIGFQNETLKAKFILKIDDEEKERINSTTDTENLEAEKKGEFFYNFKIDLATANIKELWIAWLAYFKEKINHSFEAMPSTDKEIEILEQAQNYFKLPADLHEVYKLSNGGDKLFFGLNLLSTTEILQHHLFWEDNLKGQVPGDNVSGTYTVKPERSIRPEYVNLKRMPFANDDTLNFFNIDNDPGEAGTIGQIINSGRDEYNLVVMANNITEFARKVLLRIEENKIFITAERDFLLYENGQGLFLDVKVLIAKGEW